MEEEAAKVSINAALQRAGRTGAEQLSRESLAQILDMLCPEKQFGSRQELADEAFNQCQTTKNGTISLNDFVDWAFSSDASSTMQKGADVNELTASTALRPFWLPKVGKGNRDTPPAFWAMTVKQWHLFVAACRNCPEYAEVKRNNMVVNLYDLNKKFVCPWTRNTGNSVALLMNHEKPIDAQLMISHAWGEDVDECAVAFRTYCAKEEVPETMASWFCIFAQYQPGNEPGDCGPTVQEQLAQNPFQIVISHPGLTAGMVVISTSTAELYERLWCVLEIACAQDQKPKVRTTAALSWVYGAKTWERVGKEKIPWSALGEYETAEETLKPLMSVNTQAAKCSNEDDAKMILEVVERKFAHQVHTARFCECETAFGVLDAIIYSFRWEIFKQMLGGLAETFGSDLACDQKIENSIVEQFLADDREAPNPLPTSISVHDLLKKEARGVLLLTQSIIYALDSGNNTDSGFEDDNDLNSFYKVIAGYFKQRARVSRTFLNLYHAELLAGCELDPNVDMEGRTKSEESFWHLAALSASEPALESFDAEKLHADTRGVRRKRPKD